MSEEGRTELTASGESDGLISGTFPAAGDLLVKIFEGCCCAANCNQIQKDEQQAARTMEGMPCCPQTNPQPPGKGAAVEVPEPEYAGMCEQIRLQLSLFGGPYFQFAAAFEPILNVPPGLPKPPDLDISLFGVPSLKLPSIPVALPLIPSIDLGLELPGLPLPNFPGVNFFTIDVPPFPGMPLLDMSIKPVSLGLDLIKLKLPDIPDFDPCAIAKFKGLIKPDAECSPEIPPIGINIAICWMCMLLFFLFIVMPILVILLGMKEKGMLTEDDEGNIDFGTKLNPLVSAPPRISIVHSRSDETESNLMIFKKTSANVRVIFTITGFELNKLFPGKFIHQDGEDILEQEEPNVRHNGRVISSESATYKWTIHKPDSSIEENSNSSPSRENYAESFNNFKESLINPKSLSERICRENNKGGPDVPPQSSDRSLIHSFENEGLHEVYCDVTVGGVKKVMAAFVQIGKPKVADSLPPILKVIPRYDAQAVQSTNKVANIEEPPPANVVPTQPVAPEIEPIAVLTPKKGV